MRETYLDYAATTPLDPRVEKAMRPYSDDKFGNPSSLHQKGQEAKKAIEHSRETIAQILKCRPDEIIFTSGGTESINLGVLGTARHRKKYGKHIIVSKIEHRAVLAAAEKLSQEGFEITYLEVDHRGLIDLKKLKNSLRPETILVAIMYANNEIGTIQPIQEIAKIVKSFGSGRVTPPFFTDACQAAGLLDLDTKKLHIDMLALSASKIYGPKGVGCLYVRRGIGLEPLIYGGGQEKGLRSGTENVAGIVGLGEALELAQKNQEKENRRLEALRDYFIAKLQRALPVAVLNGHPTERLPNNINISIPGVEGDAMVLYLDAKQIYISTGSACSATSLEPPHVILALGRPKELALGSLRFTLGRKTTKKDLDYTLKNLVQVVQKLRIA